MASRCFNILFMYATVPAERILKYTNGASKPSCPNTDKWACSRLQTNSSLVSKFSSHRKRQNPTRQDSNWSYFRKEKRPEKQKIPSQKDGIFYSIDIVQNIELNIFAPIVVFVINVNVLFLSNSQQTHGNSLYVAGVCNQCQCSLFKQFTTSWRLCYNMLMVFVINVNVLFLSNSQQTSNKHLHVMGCL